MIRDPTTEKKQFLYSIIVLFFLVFFLHRHTPVIEIDEFRYGFAGSLNEPQA